MIDHPRSSTLRKVNARISPFEARRKKERGAESVRCSLVSENVRSPPDVLPYRSLRSISFHFFTSWYKREFAFRSRIVDYATGICCSLSSGNTRPWETSMSVSSSLVANSIELSSVQKSTHTTGQNVVLMRPNDRVPSSTLNDLIA